jgi:DNA repair ATPase RecN
MSTARKPAVETDNLMLIIGQLLEATKAASEGLKSVGAEVQNNAKAIIAAIKTLEQVEEKLGDLDKIVQDHSNPNNLINVTRGHTDQINAINSGISDLHTLVKELKDAMKSLSTQVGTLDQGQASITSAKNVVWETAKVVAWVVTTAIALYAAMSGK